MLELSVRKIDWQQAIQELQVEVLEKMRLVLEAVGLEVVAYLKSKTDERRPPAKRGQPDRFAHPGHWADVSSILVNSYQPAEITPIAGGLRLTFTNTAPHAIYLEMKDGFFVLHGVTDPGGPVEDALRDVVGRIAPEFKVISLPRAA